MSKRDDLKGGLSNLFNDDVATPVTKSVEPTPAKETYTRATFILEQETIDTIKDFAYTKRISIKEALTLMVNTYIDNYNSDPDNEPILKRKK